MKSAHGVNFIHILQAAFTRSQKRKKDSQVVSLFIALSGSAHLKVARRTLMKLTSKD
jgi:hypothetical protein